MKKNRKLMINSNWDKNINLSETEMQSAKGGATGAFTLETRCGVSHCAGYTTNTTKTTK